MIECQTAEKQWPKSWPKSQPSIILRCFNKHHRILSRCRQYVSIDGGRCLPTCSLLSEEAFLSRSPPRQDIIYSFDIDVTSSCNQHFETDTIEGDELYLLYIK